MTPQELAWLRYANSAATRNDPLDPALIQAMSFLPEMGLTMEVFSGGQEAAGTPGAKRTGSTRHDHGKAGDVFFYKDGRKLDWANPDDRPYFEEIVRRGKAAGVTGFGAGPGYMQPGSMHIGFGTPAVWGAGGKGANSPDWLRAAYGAAPAGAAAQPQSAATAAPTGMATVPAAAPPSIMPVNPQSTEKPKTMWDALAEIGAGMTDPPQQAQAPQMMPMQRTAYVAPERDTIDPYLKFFASLR